MIVLRIFWVRIWRNEVIGQINGACARNSGRARASHALLNRSEKKIVRSRGGGVATKITRSIGPAPKNCRPSTEWTVPNSRFTVQTEPTRSLNAVFDELLVCLRSLESLLNGLAIHKSNCISHHGSAEKKLSDHVGSDLRKTWSQWAFDWFGLVFLADFLHKTRKS